MLKITFIYLLSFLLLSSQASAQLLRPVIGEQATYFKVDLPNVILKPLQDKGMTQVGDLDTTPLLNKFKKIKVGLFPDLVGFGTFSGSGEAMRSTSIYLTEEKTIMIMERDWKLTSDFVRPLIALHELLGASSYNDDHYQLTLNLWWLSTDYTHKDVDYISEAIKNVQTRKKNVRFPMLLAEGGGATAIGGGGDSVALEAKMLLLVLLDQKEMPGEQRMVLFNRIIDLQIEGGYSGQGFEGEFQMLNPDLVKIDRNDWRQDDKGKYLTVHKMMGLLM